MVCEIKNFTGVDVLQLMPARFKGEAFVHLINSKGT